MLGKYPQIAWLLGGIVVASGVAGTYLYRQGQLPVPRQEIAADTDPADKGAHEQMEADTGETGREAEKVALVLPKFDILRIEPDGSAVIAGAAPGTKTVELLVDGRVVARTESSLNGDFVFALEEPLGPGAYELTLRGISLDGRTVASDETGIVNIPEANTGQNDVIAMVNREGAAPRILQKPDSVEGDATQPQADAEAEAEAVDEGTASPPGDDGTGDRTIAAGDATDDEKSEMAATAGSRKGDRVAEETGTADAVAPDEAAVMVEAVDVEDDRLFVAGSGEPGRVVNIYIDDELLGTATIGPKRTFLLEAVKPLSDGEYEIRADMLEPGSGEVARRAAVRLIHETPGPVPDKGETVVAEATAESAGDPDEETETAMADAPDEPAGEPAVADVSEAAADTGSGEKAPAEMRPEAAGTDEPEVAATEPPPAGSDAVVDEDASEGMTVVAKKMPARETGASADGDAGASGEGVSAGGRPEKLERGHGEGTTVIARSEMPPASGESEPVVAEAEPAPAREQALAALPVVRTGDTVIIRRGDNLWRISRRMLGQGIRYTVIFDANRDQIRDPDLIYPGQVFDVPDEQGVTDRS